MAWFQIHVWAACESEDHCTEDEDEPQEISKEHTVDSDDNSADRLERDADEEQVAEEQHARGRKKVSLRLTPGETTHHE
eukprot:CAMPEP_0113667902 /NCGR_PEP_ID=MMETSP0038_2-20120614/3703_1 /TAXON_ID=2898 /ORGANISM="Cryptomonas paramecium" /LENGTH=78 /DNA_ID=CAMNT_0000583587 /DNA_START=882 /DNA_END=1118 /DNA_ORIENTATION=- /assembly_acc=CAM_ASM_000170